jgi:hypothetical protein
MMRRVLETAQMAVGRRDRTIAGVKTKKWLSGADLDNVVGVENVPARARRCCRRRLGHASSDNRSFFCAR